MIGWNKFQNDRIKAVTILYTLLEELKASDGSSSVGVSKFWSLTYL